MHHHPEGRGIPGRNDLLFDRSAMEPGPLRRMADAGPGSSGAGSQEGRRGDGAFQSDRETDESNMTI